jgi:hypothetical protein
MSTFLKKKKNLELNFESKMGPELELGFFMHKQAIVGAKSSLVVLARKRTKTKKKTKNQSSSLSPILDPSLNLGFHAPKLGVCYNKTKTKNN